MKNQDWLNMMCAVVQAMGGHESKCYQPSQRTIQFIFKAPYTLSFELSDFIV
jgi:hypothetical protein